MTATAKAKRGQKPREGDVFAIPLGDGSYGFAQVARTGDYAFFDLQAGVPPPIDEIVSRPVAFRVPLVSESASKGGWQPLGNRPPAGDLARPASYLNQPIGSNQLFMIVGNQRIPATYEQVKGLEAMGWWFEHQVRQRLLDHFSGRPNRDAQVTREIKVYDPKTGQRIRSREG
jgi:immunity protein 26 of polymorphic toxin system